MTQCVSSARASLAMRPSAKCVRSAIRSTMLYDVGMELHRPNKNKKS